MPTDPKSPQHGLRGLLKRGLLALNVLSLDAPLVAIAWQDLTARQLNAPLSLSQRVVLGLTTWLVYAGDRLLDARPDLASQSRLPRHRFAGRNRRKLLFVWILGALMNVLLIPVAMPPAAWPAAIGLGTALVLYFVACERFPQTARQIIPREVVVSLFFVAAAMFFPLARRWPESAESAGLAMLLGSTLYMLAFTNCFAIACWERREDARMGEQTLATSCEKPRLCLRYMTEVTVVTLFAAIVLGGGNSVFLATAMLSAVGLWGVDQGGSPLVRPVLADACLVIPWLCRGG